MSGEEEITAFANQRPEEVALEKFVKKGFNKLTLEELALTQVSATWREEFQRATGENWDQYQAKTAERLRRANFDMKWLTKRSDNAFAPLFTAVTRGDVARVTEYIRINDVQTCIESVDESKKTCLHLAAREGHLELVELLLTKGWSVDARDRLLNTPVHLAAYRGHSGIVSALLRKRADTQAGDSSGRKAVHYACSALDSEALKVLLKQDRDVIHYTDNSGRGPMHYVVFNNSARQIDFIRVLLENGCTIDQTDSLGRTPLHYACEAARSRCIPMLLKNGAKLSALDSSGKSPADLVKSDQIHQIISLYVKPEPEKDLGLLAPAAKGATGPLYSQNSPPKTRAKQSPSEPVLQIPVSKQERKETLLSLLKRVQEAGVNAQQHLKKPHIFSGAWMEGIATPPALLQSLAGWTPAEAVLRVYNVLFPYPKQLPVPQGDEYAIYEFYGEPWGGAQAAILESAEDVVEQRPVTSAGQRQTVVEDDRKVRELEARIASQDKELFRLRRELQTMERKAKDSTRVAELQERLLAAEDDREQAQAAKDRLQQEVSKLRADIEGFKATIEGLNKQLASVPKPEDVDDMKKALTEKDAKDRALRFKSGLLFLKSLDTKGEGEPVETEVHLQDGQVIERLSAALSLMKPSLKQRLTDVDMNADGSVTKSEMTKALDKLGMTPQDVLSLLRIAGFRPGATSVPILPFVQVVDSWESHKAALVTKLFIKIKSKFKGKPLEELFQMMDVNHDGTVSFAEFGDACNMLKLNMNREERHSVFAVLDEDHTGSISLEELKAQIESAGDIPEESIAEAEKQDEEDELNDKDEDAEAEVAAQLDSPRDRFTPDSVGESAMKHSVEFAGEDEEPEIPVVKTKQPVIKPPVVVKPATPKPAKETSQPAPQPAPQPVPGNKPLYGRLSLQIVKARDLPPGKYAVQCTLLESDGPQRTEFASGPAPEWKFRGRFKLEGVKPVTMGEFMKVELFGASGVDATAQVPWQKCIPQPGNWAVNSEFVLKDKAGKSKGFILIQLKWLPRDTLRLEGSGDLYIQPTNAAGLSDCLVFFSLSGRSARTVAAGPPWTETISLRDVKLSMVKAVPPLEVSVLDARTQKEVVKSSFNWETVLAAPNQMSQDIRMSLSSKFSLVLRLKWRPFTPEEELAIKCAIKIQAVWRGKKAREGLKLMKASPRRILRRKGEFTDGKFYLLSVTQDDRGQSQAELHPVGDPAIPMYTVLDSMRIEEGQSDLVTTGRGDKLTLGESKPGVGEEELRGDLGVKVTGAIGLKEVMLKFVIGTAFAHSLAGPPWSRPMVIQGVKTWRSQTVVTVTVIELANRAEVCQKTSDFRGCLGTPGAWSPDTTLELSPTSKLKLQYQWLPYPAETKTSAAAATKLQAAWRGKVARDNQTASRGKEKTVLGRCGVKSENGRYFLVMFYEDGNEVGVGLHQADDPGRPMYEELDYKTTREKSIPAIQSRLKVSSDGKLIL